MMRSAEAEADLVEPNMNTVYLANADSDPVDSATTEAFEGSPKKRRREKVDYAQLEKELVEAGSFAKKE